MVSQNCLVTSNLPYIYFCVQQNKKKLYMFWTWGWVIEEFLRMNTLQCLKNVENPSILHFAQYFTHYTCYSRSTLRKRERYYKTRVGEERASEVGGTPFQMIFTGRMKMRCLIKERNSVEIGPGFCHLHSKWVSHFSSVSSNRILSPLKAFLDESSNN